MKPDQYARHIESSIRREFPLSIEDNAQIVKLERSSSHKEFDVSGLLAHLYPHKVICTLQNTPCAAIWGFRTKDYQVKTLIASQGCLIQFEGDRNRSTFKSHGEVLFHGTGLFDREVCLQSGAGTTFQLIPPNWRSDWNSAWQKPSTIPITSGGANLATLILQPYRDNPSFLLNHTQAFMALRREEMLSCLAFAVILNVRFTG